MAIRDRGLLKWQGAFFMPEHVKMLRDIERDNQKEKQPILDEYEIEELENKIHYAMEFSFHVNVKIWREGFIHENEGRICRLDGLKKVIYLESENGFIERVKFEDVVGVEVLD
ncbi:YolD-like family protein [Bacillus sp. JJ1474]|uniref:YolD-like family protein n=1 Tax=Bacillus sp. JJ1474 TaxID=3122955 RepID=UPI002FFF1257